MLRVYVPQGYLVAKKYVFDFIFQNVLELDYKLLEENRTNYLIQFENNSKLEITDCFFCSWNGEVNSKLIPSSVCYNDDIFAKSGPIPIFFGKPDITREGYNCFLKFDLVGTIFFFLSRIEELVYKERDKHGRVLAKNSLLYKFNLLHRPIVDEYIYFLKKLISEYGALKVENKIGSINVTCDVDWPFDPNLRYFKNLYRNCGIELIRNKNIKKAISLCINYTKSKLGLNVEDDHRRSIEWIMDINEQKGNVVTFYFIPEPTSVLDNPESLDSKETAFLLKEIVRRGHKIGVHPGYNCVNSVELFTRSIELYRSIVNRLFSESHSLKTRMHFLRWDNKYTAKLLNELGVIDDSTMGYAEYAGFRCATAYPHKMFDIYNFEALNVIQTPLVIMESTVISDRYEGLGYSESAWERISFLKNEALKYGGTFTLLWHNCHLIDEKDRNLYLRCI